MNKNEKFEKAMEEMVFTVIRKIEETPEKDVEEQILSVKEFWTDYREDIQFILKPSGRERAGEVEFTVKIITGRGTSDRIDIYRGKRENFLKYLKNDSTTPEIIEKIRTAGMFLLMEEDRFSDFNDGWE